MKGEYIIVVGKDIKQLKERMAKYNVTALGSLTITNGTYVQSFIGELSKESKDAQESAREEKEAQAKATKERNVAKRAEQDAAKKGKADSSPRGKNFKKGSPIDRDFQERLDAGVIDSNGNTISPRARLTNEKKKVATATKDTVEAKSKEQVKTGEGYAVVEGIDNIPADMR